MIPLVWFLLVTALLPVGFVSAKPEYGVGFELTLDYGYDQNTIPAEPLDRELTCPIVLQVFNSLSSAGLEKWCHCFHVWFFLIVFQGYSRLD
jgi:hypothetical protein